MYSKIKLLGHLLHPMLVAYPIACYTGTFVAYLVYLLGGDPFWFKMGVVASITGVVMAAITAIPGFLDWFLGIPNDTAPKRTGMTHLLLNVVALVLFLIAALRTTGQFDAAKPDAGLVVVLALLGVGSTVGAGFFGWT